jgi:hypothetical protein
MLPCGSDRTAPEMLKGTMNDIWRSRVMQLWLATRLKLRIATSTPSIISGCCGSGDCAARYWMPVAGRGSAGWLLLGRCLF